MPKHLVCLTFDHDNTSPFISREMTSPTPLSRGDFGMVASDRILGLLAKHRIATTWFIPGSHHRDLSRKRRRGGEGGA